MTWKRAKPWVRRVVGLIVMAGVFGWMGHKISRHWADVKDHAGAVSWVSFATASAMFAFFLFAFRAMEWRLILARFGHKLSPAPATRIWSTSELARYVPGVVWQVAGRVYLVRPYGVGKTVCAASQIIELILFLLANLLVGFGCLVAFGIRHMTGKAETAMLALAPVVPLLVIVLHPKILYGLTDRIMTLLKKQPVAQRLTGAELISLLGWSVLGLLWQSVAVFLIVHRPLGLGWDKCYVVAGAYCLAWCAGFLAVLNPGGLGVREGVFVAAMTFAMPPSTLEQFSNSKAAMAGLLAFLSGLLRLWTIAGELILTSFAYAIDHRGARGQIEAMPVEMASQ